MKQIILILFLCTAHIVNAKTTNSSILFLGDSLTEGLGVDSKDAYPYLIELMIQNQLHKNITVINGGVSGSTTSDAFARLKWYLKKKPSIVFIALGANDGLRGLDLKQSQKNLEKIIQYALDSNAKVLLARMLIPPNYGIQYVNQFKKIYTDLQTKYKLKNIPFLLENVAGKKELNQRDGIHPNEKGHAIIAQTVFKYLKEEL